jgi:hypothetical protein
MQGRQLAEQELQAEEQLVAGLREQEQDCD